MNRRHASGVRMRIRVLMFFISTLRRDLVGRIGRAVTIVFLVHVLRRTRWPATICCGVKSRTQTRRTRRTRTRRFPRRKDGRAVLRDKRWEGRAEGQAVALTRDPGSTGNARGGIRGWRPRGVQNAFFTRPRSDSARGARPVLKSGRSLVGVNSVPRWMMVLRRQHLVPPRPLVSTRRSSAAPAKGSRGRASARGLVMKT